MKAENKEKIKSKTQKNSSINKQLKKELEKFYSAVEQTADAVFFTDINGIIQYVNPAFEQLTGFSKKEVLGKTPRIIKSGLQSAKHYKKLWTTILSGKSFRNVVVNRKKNGELFYADHTITPIKNTDGSITHFVGIWKDITKQKLSEMRKDQFISIAGHELKNPVTNIKLYNQLLQTHFLKKKDKKALYFLTNIDSQTDKLIKLINDLLDIEKIKVGKLSLTKELFRFDHLLNRIILDFQYANDNHEIIKKGESKLKVYADKDRIGQVLINLISNALKYSPFAEKIIVYVEEKDKNIIVGVQDFGIGIEESEKKKIFEPFYRSKSLDGKGFPGLGIGLHIAAEIVDLHNGKIWVQSKPEKGSTFYFSLPCKIK